MTTIKLLNNVDHADLRVLRGHGAAFGDDLNQLPVFPAEIEAAQRHYPIVFRRDPGGPLRAVALLGFDARENLFLDGTGWDASYVPAIQRRGPFSIGLRGQGADANAEPVIHVDLDHPRVSRTEGEPVFRPHGGTTPFLDQAAEALRVIHEGIPANEALAAALGEAGLLQPVALDVEVAEGVRYSVNDVLVVSDARLAALDGPTLAELNAAGHLRHAVLLAASLGNMAQLGERKRAKLAAGTAAA